MPRVLRHLDLPLDAAIADALGSHDALPAAPGLAFGQAVGLAWAARSHAGAAAVVGATEPVVVVAPADELRLSLAPELADLAVAERLSHLVVVAIVDDETSLAAADAVAHALTLRGFAAQSLRAPQLEGAIRRAGRTGRPSLLVCSVDGRATVALTQAPFVPPPMEARTLLPVAFEGRARDVGAFAVGVALEGRHAPVAVVPIDDADGLKPALRAAVRHELPGLFYVTEDAPPEDALWSLRLCPGVDVWRPADLHEAAAIASDWLAAGGIRVVALGPDPVPFENPIPSDLTLGAAVVADAVTPLITLVATGSEVALAVEVQRALGLPARVVAVPSVERFARLPDLVRRRLLGSGAIVVLEAGVPLPWRALFGADAVLLTDHAALDVAGIVALLDPNEARAALHA